MKIKFHSDVHILGKRTQYMYGAQGISSCLGQLGPTLCQKYFKKSADAKKKNLGHNPLKYDA